MPKNNDKSLLIYAQNCRKKYLKSRLLMYTGLFLACSALPSWAQQDRNRENTVSLENLLKTYQTVQLSIPEGKESENFLYAKQDQDDEDRENRLINWDRYADAFVAQYKNINQRIMHVNDGIAQDDLINMSQYMRVKEKIDAIKVTIYDYLPFDKRQTGLPDGVTDYNPINMRQYNELDKRLANRVDVLNRQLRNVESESHDAGAMAMALSGLDFDRRPQKFSLSASIGSWKTNTALAMGMGYVDKTGNVRANANVGMGLENFSMGVSASLSFLFE